MNSPECWKCCTYQCMKPRISSMCCNSHFLQAERKALQSLIIYFFRSFFYFFLMRDAFLLVIFYLYFDPAAAAATAVHL